jgi:hypothetical protein
MDEDGGGWILFSSIVLVIAGCLNIIWGIAALTRDEYFVSQVLFANLTFWGWFAIIFGTIAACAGIAVQNSKAPWARWFGIIWSSVAVLCWFMVIWAAPVMVIIIIVAYLMVICGLVLFGYREDEV